MHSSQFLPRRASRRGPALGLAVVIAASLVIAPLGSAAAAQPDYQPDPTATPGTFMTTNVAADRTSENFFYRIPALAHLGDGVVLASWDARPGSAADAPNPNSIMQRRSVDNGVTWGPAQIIASGQVAAPRYGYSDPSYVVDGESGTVFAFFVYSKDAGFAASVYGDDDANRDVISSAVIASTDGGLTWSEPRLITDVTKTSNGTTADGVYQPVEGDVLTNFAASGEGIQLRYGEHAGRVIQQFSGRVRQANGSTLFQAYSVYSDDHGATWQRGAFVGTAMDENKVVELSDGRVMLNSRDSSNGRTRWVAISEDGGQTWGPVARDAQLPDPTNNASITRLFPDAAEGSADAQKLLFTNANNGADGSRVNGAARVSCDDGVTWPGLRTIDAGSFGYSTATRLDDGRIGVLWERDYTNDLQFSSFDDAWLNYVCAPLRTDEQTLDPAVAKSMPVTITNQESEALSGTVAVVTPAGWTATEAVVDDLAPGESVTVDVRLTAPADATGTHLLQTAFTSSDGRVSQYTSTLRLPQPVTLGLTLTSTNTSTARDVVARPYQAGEVLSFTVRVASTSSMPTLATPTESNFTTGFAPTACRWNNLAALGAYNCTTPRRTLTADDIERGWFAPQFTFAVAPMTDTSASAPVTFTGAAVALRDGVLGATIVGSRADGSRDLAAQPYAAGDQVPYSFRIDSTSPVAATVAPTNGDFQPLVPPGAGNCRWTNLAPFAGYTCATPRHTVTADEVAQGFFAPRTTWTVTATGQTPAEYEIDGGEVDLLVRDPGLSGGIAGSWQDADGDGYASAGDTVTFRYDVVNTGNVRLDDVVAGDLADATLAAGTDAEARSSVVTLTADHIAAASVSPEPLTATARNGERAVTATITATPFALDIEPAEPLPPAWDGQATYGEGDRVSYGGVVFEALWWTRNQIPGDSPWGAWAEIASTTDGVALWTASRIFTVGEIVEYAGVKYRAKWWTRNQAPGDPWGPWERFAEQVRPV